MLTSRRIEVTVFSFAAVPHLVVETGSVGTVHTRLAHPAQRSLPLKLSRELVPVLKMQQAVQWHKCRTQAPALVWLHDLLRQSVLLTDARAA
ncbi:hypothetical protein [Azohydromonas australica]|uniref:hypothetical protein n=1 Tax=Azohydromonas australica TaxID=364039 RepID=UPI00040A7A90|nr:hypothetical protein [Azohydromonas australica]